MSSNTTDAVVIARDVRKEYFRKGSSSARYFDAVPRTSMELKRGELVEVVGRSGGGKTTLLSMMAGLLAPTEGVVLVDGQDLYALSDAQRSRLRNARFGVVPQGQTPLMDLTVLQNVCLPAQLYGKLSAEETRGVEQRALELLERIGVADLAQSYPAELSGGELRRMAIARALVCKPDVVFADEPTGDLDDHNTDVVLQVLRDAANDGAAVMLVTHEQAAAAYADRIVRMEPGASN